MADDAPRPLPPTAMPSALRSDGTLSVTRLGLERSVWSDLFHLLVTASWPKLFALIAALYLAVNVVFALAYLVQPGEIAGAREGSLADALAFSVQTFATIGYGVFSPATPLAHALVAVESLCGIVFSAIATGLMFSKFARPTARVMFARTAPVATHEGVPTLHVRVANARTNQLVEAAVKIRISRNEVTAEGHRMRRFYDLKLLRDTNPIFALTWTIFHPIDRDSPLWGATPESLRASQAMLIVVVTGTDDTVMQSVHARAVYASDQIVWDARYADMMSFDAAGRMVLDYTRFHDTVPVPPPAPAASTPTS